MNRLFGMTGIVWPLTLADLCTVIVSCAVYARNRKKEECLTGYSRKKSRSIGIGDRTMKTEMFRELTGDELDLVTREILKDRLLSARLLDGGLFNTTYLAETEGHGTVVLRAGPVNRHLLLPYERFLMEAEVEVYRLCAENGIPTSEVLASDTSKTKIDRDVMFVKYIPSTPLSECEASLSAEESEEIFRELGRAMSAFNGISGKKFGRIADVLHGGGFASWSKALGKELDEWEQACRQTELVPRDRYGVFREAFECAAESLDRIEHPHLLHNDLWSGNVLLSRDDTGKRHLAAVIDADRAIWGDPDMEVFWLGRNTSYFCKAYLNSAKSVPEDTPERSIRKSLYRMLSLLWAVYIYGYEYSETDLAERELAEAGNEKEKLTGGR